MSRKLQLRIGLLFCVLALSTVVLSAAQSAGAAGDAFSLTVNVNPAGKGSVNVNPPPPYGDGQIVTLTATPVTGWLFDKWVLAGDTDWWNNDWNYRVEVTAAAAGHARKNKPAEINLDFTALWTSLGKTGTLDPNSIRVIEVDSNGNVIDDAVPFQFDKTANFNAATKATGTLVLLMQGNTPAGATRRYHVYFDVTGKGFAPPAVTPRITLTQGVSDAGAQAHKIETLLGTYFLHPKGGGLSSLNDAGGNDWINYKENVIGNGGTYRGIPNAVSPNNGGHFHPGSNTMTTTLLNEGPLKVTYNVKERKAPNTRVKWEGTFEFYPEYVVFTMIAAPYKFWFLYEGTPGGQLQLASDFLVRSDGTQTLASAAWSGDLVDEEWAYVGDPGLGRSIYFVNHTDDTLNDSYDDQGGLMTKLGFGRTGAGSLLDNTVLPREFTFGLMNETVYDAARPIVYNAYKDLNVSVGAARERAGASLGSTNPVNFTITGEHTITAHFKPAQFSVNVTPNPADKGVVTRTPDKALYDYGEQVTLAAAPVTGWVFAGWSGDVTGTTNPITVNVTQNMNVTATFSQSFTVTTSADPTDGGTVTVTPDKPSYQPGEQIQVTATANSGYSFTNWSGDLSGTNPTEFVTVNGNLNIVANFSAAQYTFDATSSGNGSVAWIPNKPLYGEGEVVTVTATPDTNFVFAGWTGDRISSDNPLEVTITGNTSVVANFAPIQYHTLTTSGVGGGTVTRSPDLAQYPTGTPVTLTAVPDAQKRFVAWGGGANGTENPIQVTVNSDMTVLATFEDDVYPLTTNVIGQGSIAKLPDQPAGYFIGQVVTLTGIAAPGWTFSAWSGDASGVSATTAITMTGPANVTATFTQLPAVTLTTSVIGDGAITIEPDKDEYAWGETVMLTAEPGFDSVFAGWTGDVTSNNNPLTLTMDGNKNVVARFIVPTGPFTDNFNSCNLDTTMWGQPVNPSGVATFVANGTSYEIRLPEGTTHNIWKDINNAPRILQPADNTDFEIVAKFNSDVALNSQMQGIIVEQDSQNLVRFNFNYLNGQAYAYAATLTAGTPKRIFELPLPVSEQGADYLRVTREGDEWYMAYSLNGVDWIDVGQKLGTLNKPKRLLFPLNVDRAGVFAGNVKPKDTPMAPAFTAKIDYFQNTATGPVPEDTPLLSINVVGGGTVTPTPPANQLACGQTVSLAAVAGFGWQFSGWSGDATGSQNPLSMLINRPRTVTATFTSSGISYIMLPSIIRP